MYLATSRVVRFLFFFLFLPLAASGQSGKIHKFQIKGDMVSTNFQVDSRSILINYSLSEINLSSISTDNGPFYKITAPGHLLTADPGKPELPMLSRLITIPEGSKVKIKISNVESTRITPSKKDIKGMLFPSQYGETKQKDRTKPEFVLDKKIYSTRGLIKSDTVKIEYLGKIRGKPLSNLIISPVRYNPVSNYMEVITSMKILISFTQDIVSPAKSLQQESPLFDQILAKGVLNYYPDNLVTGYSDKPVGMIVVADTTFRNLLKPFIRWKTQKGFRVQVLYTGEAETGSTYTEIKEAIYKTFTYLKEEGNAPEYLLLIGDVKKIPYFGSGNISDTYYAEFDGNGDFIPDMFIGRIPATDTSDARSVLNKIIQYEKFEFQSSNTFYSKALALAGKDINYANYMNGQIKYAITNYLKSENKINAYYFYYPDGFTKKDSVIKLINNGLSFINYTGHGASSGWLHLELKSPDIVNFRNENMYPFIISNACRTAQFNDTSSFGNKLLLAKKKGAIGFIGCSNDSYWDEDFNWAVGAGVPGADPKYGDTGLGFYDRLFHTHGELPSEWYTTMGQINFAGNLAVSSTSSLRKKYYWETYTLLGDPSVTPLVGTPAKFNIALPDTLPVGIKSLTLNGDPFSYISISHSGTLCDASFFSPSGSAVLDFPAYYNDSCLVVVTGQNKIPLLKTIYFSNLKGEFINLSKTILIDSLGNDNGKADFGETVFLNLTISNLGEASATNLTAHISSTSPWVTIIKGTAAIGTLAGKSQIQLQSRLEIKIANDVPDQGIVTLDLTLKDDKGEKKMKIDIQVHAPRLEIVNLLIDDSFTGNNNTIADPGETFDLVFQIRNLGSSNTSGQLEINSNDEDLTIPDPNIKSGILQFGENSYIRVTVKLSETAMFGDFITLQSTLNCNPYIVNRAFSFRVGRVRESFESSTFTVFPWINISQIPWILNRSDHFDGNISAQSGAIGHNASTRLMIRTYFPNADSLKFYYKVSSEQNYDYLQFNLNDTEFLKASGETSWLRKSVFVAPGLNKMEWIYKKDNSVSQGMDCAWVDLIDFSVSNPLRYIQRDIQLARLVNPVQKSSFGLEPVTVRLYNLGSDTIDGFNLAYQVNGNIPVRQFFATRILPYQDSATVTFDKRADLDHNGTYNLTVYGYGNGDDYLMNDTLVVSLENNELDEDVTVYPNPFMDNVTVLITSNITDRVRISMYDVTGKILTETQHEIAAGENRIVLETATYGASMYFLSVKGSQIYKVIPVIKLKN